MEDPFCIQCFESQGPSYQQRGVKPPNHQSIGQTEVILGYAVAQVMKVIITDFAFGHCNVIFIIEQPLPRFIKSCEFSSIEDRYRLPRSQSLHITTVAQADAGDV